MRDGCWSHSGGLSLAGVEVQRGSATLGQGKESFVSRWSLLMLHSLSALGPERSLIAFWEALWSGAPAEQPRESAYAWGTAWATSLLWPSSQGQPAWPALRCLERGPSPACPLSAVLVLSVAGVAGLAPSMTLLRAASQMSRCRSTRKCFPPLSGGVGLCSKLRHKTKANRQKQNQVNNGNRGGRSFGLAARIVTVERSGWVEQKDWRYP